MPIYSQADLLRVARRVNNSKRPYLLVNPLQAKHVPVSPERSLEMMNCLGDQLAEKYPETRLVIGFAETATAIGAAIASRLPQDCVYLPTTREDLPEVGEWVLFSEEHSHATEQKLCGDHLPEWIDRTPSVIFVDDEISTGKTLRNMICRLRERYPRLTEKKLAAASLLNRVSPEDGEKLAEAGISCEWLVRLEADNAARKAEAFQVEEAAPAQTGEHAFSKRTLDCAPLRDPRGGVLIQTYLENCGQIAGAFLDQIGAELSGVGDVVVLGTEECMYPALVLGRALEQKGFSVRCHATTRSPIGICGADGYPITSGNKLSSFYGEGRDTYIYDFAPCGALIVVSDAAEVRMEALNGLVSAWAPYGFQRFYFLQGGRNVWYL